MATYLELAEAAEVAILDIAQNGQSITFQGHTYNKANLSDLFALSQKYRNLDAASTQTSHILQRVTYGISARWQNV